MTQTKLDAILQQLHSLQAELDIEPASQIGDSLIVLQVDASMVHCDAQNPVQRPTIQQVEAKLPRQGARHSAFTGARWAIDRYDWNVF